MHSSQDMPLGPSRARLGVLFLLCTLSFVLYIDRVCIGQAALSIKKEFGLSNIEFSWVLNSFLLAYALFEVPAGRWGDRYGSRRVLIRIVLWWSAFTALTAASAGLISLVMTRFLFGAGEAGALPNVARVIRRWFPPGERGRAQGLTLASASIGGALAPMAAAYLIEVYGWRMTFVLFGVIGWFWVVAFWFWFRDDPAEHPSVNAAELQLLTPPCGEPLAAVTHESIPWGAVVRNRNVWLLGIITSCGAYCSYLYFSWLPTYLQEGHHLSSTIASGLSSMVLAGGVVGTLLGGLVADRISLGPVDVPGARRRFGFAVELTAAVLILAAIQTESSWGTAGLMSISCLLMTLQQAIWWGTTMEISGRHLGALFGLLNAMGVVGGFVSQFVFAAVADWRGGLGYSGRAQWNPALYSYATVLILAAICWLFVDPSKRIEQQSQPAKNNDD